MEMSTEHVWEAFHTPLWQFIRKRVPDEQGAEDILQNVFLKVHTHIDTIRQREKLPRWLYQVTRNAIVDYYRDQQPTTSLDQSELQFAEEPPEESVESTVASWLPEMLECLPEVDREALRLTDYQGMKQRELAQRLGLSFSGAKSRVQRAREKLKQAVLDCCHLEFDRLGHVIEYQPWHHRCATQPLQVVCVSSTRQGGNHV